MPRFGRIRRMVVERTVDEQAVGETSHHFSQFRRHSRPHSSPPLELCSSRYDSSSIQPLSYPQFLIPYEFMLTEIEIVDNNASLFSSSIKNHPICLLIKLAVINLIICRSIHLIVKLPINFFVKERCLGHNRCQVDEFESNREFFGRDQKHSSLIGAIQLFFHNSIL